MREVKKLPALDLYNSEGWINIPALAALDCWCYVIVGKRQVGKTFGVLEHIISNGGHFLYLRRTKEELKRSVLTHSLIHASPLKSTVYGVISKRLQAKHGRFVNMKPARMASTP